MTHSPENRWPIDGHDHRHIERSSIYENPKIRAFLDGNNITLLIASKGMGKTLLLRVKKKLITSSPAGIILIPASDAEFDEPKLHGTFPTSGYQDLLLWKDLWSFAIIVSSLTHIPALAEDPEKQKSKIRRALEPLPINSDLKDEIAEDSTSMAQHVPSHYLSKLVDRHSENELQKLRKAMFVIDDLSEKFISSGIYIFIDAFDQSLQEAFGGNLDAWRNGQLGLIKAAHTLFTKNHHIKVFATIRQEAWAGFIDADRQVIKGKSLILEPTEADLRKLITDAIRRHTSKGSIEEFLGVQKISNAYCDIDEDCFRYIYRHSSASPRSLMQFAKALDEAELYELSHEERMKQIRDVIDETSAENVVSDYLQSQKQMFMKTLNTKSRLLELLKLIPSNVLTAESLKIICKRFCETVGIPPEEAHPFCELFNSGLVGEVRFDPASDGFYQYFRKPYEFDWVQQEILKDNAIYVVHPGLVSHIVKNRSLSLNRFNVVGPDYPWASRRKHTGIPTVFISHSSLDRAILEPFLEILQDELNLIFPTNLWVDNRMIVAGDNIHTELEHGVAASDLVVLFASKSSLSSGWVEEEWRTKHQKEVEEQRTRVVVAIIDKTKPMSLPTLLNKKLAAICSLGNSSQRNAHELALAISKHLRSALDVQFRSNVA